MFTIEPLLSRRAFLKRSAQLLALACISRIVGAQVTHTAAAQQRAWAQSYGSGLYGQGSYPGYQAYLPLINQEYNHGTIAETER